MTKLAAAAARRIGRPELIVRLPYEADHPRFTFNADNASDAARLMLWLKDSAAAHFISLDLAELLDELDEEPS